MSTPPPSKLPISEARVSEAKAPLRTPDSVPLAGPSPRFVAWFTGAPIPRDLALASGLDAGTLAQLQARGLPVPVLRGAAEADLGAADPRLTVAELKAPGIGPWIAGASLGIVGMLLGAASLLLVPAVGSVALFAGLALGVAGPAMGAAAVTRALREPSAQRQALRLAAASPPPSPLQARVHALALQLREVDLPKIAESDLMDALANLNSDLAQDPDAERLAALEEAVVAVEHLLARDRAAEGQKSDPEAVLRLAKAAHQARRETQ